MADLSEQIQQTAIDPAAAAVDGQSVTANRVEQVVLADQYLSAKGATGRRRGLAFSKIIPPGPLEDCGKATGFNQGIV